MKDWTKTQEDNWISNPYAGFTLNHWKARHSLLLSILYVNPVQWTLLGRKNSTEIALFLIITFKFFSVIYVHLFVLFSFPWTRILFSLKLETETRDIKVIATRDIYVYAPYSFLSPISRPQIRIIAFPQNHRKTMRVSIMVQLQLENRTVRPSIHQQESQHVYFYYKLRSNWHRLLSSRVW